jgi:hypothetical protein
MTWVVEEPAGCCAQEYFVETQEQAERLAKHLNSQHKSEDHWTASLLIPMGEERVNQRIADDLARDAKEVQRVIWGAEWEQTLSYSARPRVYTEVWQGEYELDEYEDSRLTRELFDKWVALNKREGKK